MSTETSTTLFPPATERWLPVRGSEQLRCSGVLCPWAPDRSRSRGSPLHPGGWTMRATVFECHELALRLYRQRGNRLGAARMATWIGLDHYLYRGHAGLALGWMRQACRLLEGLPPSAEHGWLRIWEAYVRLMERNDVAFAVRAGEDAASLASDLGLVDMETLAIALAGLARVGTGDIEQGLSALDDAAAVALSGALTDIDTIVTTLCFVIFACEQVRDFPRAVQWCDAVEDVSRRWSYRSMFGVCRCHHASVMLWRGDWSTAEAELVRAAPELLKTRPGWLHESTVRLAELRLWQGRINEAKALFAQSPSHPITLVRLAGLALDDGDVESARDLVERFSRRVPAADRLGRTLGAEIAIQTWLRAGETNRAREILAEVFATAEAVGTSPLRGLASLCQAIVVRAGGDLEGARRAAEDAVDSFIESGAPFETARARFGLAIILQELGRLDGAVREAREAISAFERLGAQGELRRAASLRASLGIPQASAPGDRASDSDLTPRETEVLGLIARGLANDQIADALSISVRTVERHISTIYSRIGTTGSPAARSIAVVYAIEHGLAGRLASP